MTMTMKITQSGAFATEEQQEMAEACSAKPVFRLRLTRVGASGDIDRRVAFLLLEDALGDPELFTSEPALSTRFGRGAEPASSPRLRFEKRLKEALKSSGLDREFKIDEGPLGFGCPDTKVWGLRAALRPKVKSKSRSKAVGDELSREMDDSAMASLFAPLAKALGAPILATFRDDDVKDCAFLYEEPVKARAISSAMERVPLDASTPSMGDLGAPSNRGPRM